MNKLSKFSSSLLITSLIISPVSGIIYQNNHIAKANHENININKKQNNIDVKKLDKYVKFNKEKGIFKFEKNSKLTPEEITFLENKINESNKAIKDLNIGKNEQIKYLSKGIKVISKPKLKEGISFRYAEGIDAVDIYWWGMDVWLSRTTLNRAVKTGAIIGGIFIAKGKVWEALNILGIWGAPVPGGIYMKVHYPFGIAEVRWHG